ncbi:hypothetical protein JWE23_19535, partial [Acinetobacter baumannii]|uniref:hypothetical protein n=1 Tax=Acinetobacter baumannii TaxID=470 RepID=UPI001C11D7B4
NYTWFWPSDWTYAGGQGTPHLLLNAGSNVGGAQVGVRVANNCDAGGSPAIQFVQVNSCGFSFVASPNPSTGTTTITAKQPPTNGKAEKIEKIYQLRVLSSSGITRKQYDYPGGVTTTVINLADLAPGTYAIQAFNGSVWGSAQVIKQ